VISRQNIPTWDKKLLKRQAKILAEHRQMILSQCKQLVEEDGFKVQVEIQPPLPNSFPCAASLAQKGITYLPGALPILPLPDCDRDGGLGLCACCYGIIIKG